jgi:hypothetical protein
MSWYFTPVLYAIFVLDLKIVNWKTVNRGESA